MSDENEIIEDEVAELSVEDEVRAAMHGDEEPEEVEPEPEVEIADEEPEVEIEPAPQALSGEMKAKWKDLPADVRAEWSKRENDINQALTRHDGDLNMGRKMKEAINPYMATIQAEGGTPEGAVKDLLNTAYVLRTGSASQKVALLQEIAQQYGIDMNQAMQPQQQVNPDIAYLMNEIAALRQSTNPEAIRNQLQEQMESANIKTEVDAFASNPKNNFLEQVKPLMASLLSSGQAKDLQEAYDKACWSDPTIRTSLLAAQNTELDAKRKAEVRAKKQASVSINGSPDLTSPIARTSDLSVEDEVRAAMLESRNSI